MNNPMKIAFSLMVALAASQPAQGLAQPAPRLAAPLRQPAAAVDAFHAALCREDTAAAAALLTSDALIYESGRAERSKAEYAAHHLPADAAFAKATRRTVTGRSGQADGNLAWVATETKTVGTFGSKAINSIGKETMLLQLGRGGWRIVHVHWSSADAK
jgi:ketosteroid isomerase-like protein